MVDQVAQDSVSVAPEVFLLIAGHSTCHPRSAVHGVLIGTRMKHKVNITDAYPICHETPTKTLVETSLSIVLSTLDGNVEKTIVGWYTAPELLADKRAGPVALRIAANLVSDDATGQPVLLVVNNESIVELSLEKECMASSAIQAYGKDFGMQWMEPLDTIVLRDSDAANGLKSMLNSNVNVRDLIDHWGAGASSEWTSASSLKKNLD
jgi:Uncharacterised protein family (UPF0172)